MTVTSPFRFDAAYREDVTLPDGTRVVLRLVQPADRELVRRGFADLSEASRYLRFFARKADLSDAELTQLTELDGINQLALGAVRTAEDGTEEGLGIARFVRDPQVPEVAEAAVTVTDAAQGMGLGTLLLDRLASAARERRIAWFRGEFLSQNDRVRSLISEACPDALLVAAGDSIRVEVPLGHEDGPPPNAPGRGLLQHAAGGRLALRVRHLLLEDS